MANWCIVFLSTYVFLAFCGCAYSFKCYSCATSSVGDCDRDQTLKDCQENQGCATAKYTQVDDNGHLSSQTYTKNCLPLPFINNFCVVTNSTGKIFNCSITHCLTDYCNGPTPPPTTVTTDEGATGTSPVDATTQEPTTTLTKGETKSGSPLTNVMSSVLCLTVMVLTLDKIL